MAARAIPNHPEQAERSTPKHKRPDRLSAFQKDILEWYAIHKRDLPWRKTHDPYKILVSEVMLQQTQVDRVIPYYEFFTHTLPTFKSLAQAEPSTVIMLWSGLGYNRRAVQLQAAAKEVLRRKAFPKTADDLTTLPGIGPYTAQAILAFAYNLDAVPVDTNIRRIFSRQFFKGAGDQGRIDNAILDQLPSGRSRDWNNALMDLGSVVCTASAPACERCPVKSGCSAYKAGTQADYFKPSPPQARFEGSRRQSRGQVLRMLKRQKTHQMTLSAIQRALKRTQSETQDILGSLEKDRLVVREGKRISLP